MKHLLKRFLAMVLVICTVATMVMPACAEGTETSTDPSAALSLSAKLDSENKQIAVTVSLEEGANLTGAQARLEYDSSVVTFASFKSEDQLPNGAADDIAYDGGSYVELIFGGWAASEEEEVSTTESIALGTVIFDITDTSVKQTEFSLSDGSCTNYAAVSAEAVLGEALTVNIRYDITPAGEKQDDGSYKVENGSYTVDKTDAMPGETVTITPNPKTGYEVAKVTVNDGEPLTANENGIYTFTMPEAEARVSVTFQAQTYGITVDEVQNGEVAVTVNGEPAEKAPTEATVTLTLTPKKGYSAQAPEVTYRALGEDGREEHPTVDVTPVEGEDNTYTFTMPAGDVTVQATFTANQYQITTEAAHGTITVAEKAYTDETVTFTVTADAGYQVAKVTMNGEALTADETGEYTFTMPGEDAKIVATIDAEEHSIDVNQPAHGEIDVKSSAATDEIVTVTVTPKAGYSVTEVTVAGAEVTKVSDTEYTFTMPAYDVEVFATIEANTYNITKAGTEHGTFEVASSAKTDEDVTITVFADAGYMVDQVTVTGADVTKGDGTNYHFTMPASDVEVSVTFKAEEHDIVVNQPANGEIDVNPTAATDEEVTVTVTPKAGYSVTAINVQDNNGNPVTVENGKFKMPASGVTVSATIEANTYKISKADTEHGSFTVQETAKTDEEVTIKVTPDTEYLAAKVAVTGAEVTKVDDTTYTFKMPAQDVTVSVTFELKQYQVEIAGTVNGTAKADKTNVAAGTDVTITAAPADGYEVDSITVLGVDGFTAVSVSNNGDGTYTFKMPTQDVNVTVTFVEKIYQITTAAVSNGTVTVDKNTAKAGETVTVTVTANTGYLVSAVTVNAEGVTVTDKGNGTYTFVMPTQDVMVSASYQVENPFVDVKSSDWFYPYVLEAYSRGLMSGTGDNEFSPNGTTTRAMFVQILYAMAGKPEVTINNPFVDVSDTAWYAKAVQWAYENKVTGGTSDTTFSPDDQVTREQIAQFLYAYVGKPEVTGDLAGFADASKVSSWAKTAVIWATQNGIISGSDDNGTLYLNPGKSASRAEAATMMVGFAKFLEK